jgi:hypothetical protein
MTRDRNNPDALPKFSVNVVPTSQIRNSDLVSLLEVYRSGGTEPLIFGDDNKPEAAVIPFSAFVRLMKYDHAGHVRKENTFRDELSRRVQDAGARSAAGEAEEEVTVEQLAEDLGQVGRQWAEERRAVRPDRADHDG